MDEEQLTVFLAQTQPNPAKSTDPNLWWSLRRPMGNTQAGERVVYSPYQRLFPHLYAQLFMDTPRMGPDNPSERGFPARTTTDFWENSRRHARCTETDAANNPNGLPTLGETGCPSRPPCPSGYASPGSFPSPNPFPEPSVPKMNRIPEEPARTMETAQWRCTALQVL